MPDSRRWTLRHHVESQRLPAVDDFRLENAQVREPEPGELLVRPIYLSMDPYMRGRISPSRNYTSGVGPGQLMTGRAVAQVVQSRATGFASGDIVMGETGWQELCVAPAPEFRRVDPSLAPISTALGLLGMPGLSAYFALLDLGEPRPGDTVVITAASGAVGSAAGQIARIAGCRTIAVVGSDAKADYCIRELGYDAALNYRIERDMSAAVAAAAPAGVDVFFDNSGGTVHQAVVPHLSIHARVVICGVMSQYNPIAESAPAVYNLRHLLVSRARVSGFLIYDYAHRTEEGLQRLAAWYREGRLRYRESVMQGLESAPEAFSAMLRGQNLGKQLVQLAPDPTR